MRVIRRVVEAVGADYVQWRVLTRVMLKNDFRSATGLSMGRADLSIWRSFLIYAAFGGFVALVAASVTVFLPGLMLPGTIVATQVGVVLAMIVLIDFQSVVISPDDYDVLAHQPVSSGTYFLVKLTNVLIFTLIIGALLGGPSVILLLVAYGPLVAAGGILALVGITTATTLAILCTYAALLNVVHPRRLVRVLSTVQMIVVAAVMLFPIYIDNLFGPALERMMSGDGAIPTPAWVLLAPPAWFASLLPLSAGDWNPGYACRGRRGRRIGRRPLLPRGREAVRFLRGTAGCDHDEIRAPPAFQAPAACDGRPPPHAPTGPADRHRGHCHAGARPVP